MLMLMMLMMLMMRLLLIIINADGDDAVDADEFVVRVDDATDCDGDDGR